MFSACDFHHGSGQDTLDDSPDDDSMDSEAGYSEDSNEDLRSENISDLESPTMMDMMDEFIDIGGGISDDYDDHIDYDSYN